MTLNAIIANFQTFKLVDLLDIIIIAFLIYQLLGIVNRTRAGQLAKGALLVLGTEECMYPALTVGSLAEQTGLCATVRCHATTRSPIGICPDSAYPIRNGVLLPSFYGGDRKTYLYDLAAYDAALVVTDAPAAVDGTACTRLAAALGQLGCPRLYLCRI